MADAQASLCCSRPRRLAEGGVPLDMAKLSWCWAGLVLAATVAGAACSDDDARDRRGDEDDDGSGAGGEGGEGGSGGGCPDLDGDGHSDATCGGDDCADDDATAFPGALDGADKEVIGVHGSATDRLGLAIGADGTLHVVQPGYLTYWQHDGTSWESQVLGEDSNSPSMALDASGAIHVAYGAFDPADGKGVRYGTNAGGAWQSEWIALSPFYYADDVSLGIGPDGTIHVAYVAGQDGGNVRYAEKTSGGVWEHGVIATDSSASGISLAVAADGTVHVVYDAYGLRYATKNGASWDVEEIPNSGSHAPALALDEAGIAHVAFLGRGSTSSGYEQLFYATNDGGAWHTETVDGLADGDSVYWYWRPAIGVTPEGVLIAYGSGNPRALRVASNARGTWELGTADAHGNVGYSPELAIDESGRAHAVYLELCAGELRHAALAAPDGVDSDCDGAVDAVALPEPASCDSEAPPQPISFEASCTTGSGAFSSFIADDRSGPELHVVGVYESPSGVVDVHVDRQTPAVLILSSYERVTWRVTVSEDACLQKIIASSHSLGCVAAPEGVEVEYRYAAEELGDCGYQWPTTTGGCDTSLLVAAAEDATGLPLASFSGCYESSSFTLAR
jgi:hypothetical protein